VCVLAPTDAHTERTLGGRAVVPDEETFCDETHRILFVAVGGAVREIG